MSLDQQLPASLRQAADDHLPPLPDLQGIVDGGRSRRRRRDARRGLVVAACLAVLAVVPVVVSQGDEERLGPVGGLDTVTRVTDLPVGGTPTIPYCPGDGTIRGAGAAIERECDVIISRSGSTIYPSRRGVEQLVDGQARLLDSRTWSAWFPAVSQDGRWAAWVTDEGPGGTLLAFDLQTGERVAEVPWSTSSGWVSGIDDFGRVFFQAFEPDSGPITMYDLRSRETIEVTGVPEHGTPSIRFTTADGFGIRTEPREDVVIEGVVTADGRFTQQREVGMGWGTSFSPDRSRVAYESNGRLVVAVTGSTGPPVPLRLPTQGEPISYPTWETEDSLLVPFDPAADPRSLGETNGFDVRADRTWLLRCYVTDGSCEVALQPPWGDRMRGPVYR